MSYQKITGTLSQGGHPGSYNGQDAYNDMLVTNENIRNATNRRVQGVGTSVFAKDEGLQGLNRFNFEGGCEIDEAVSRNEILRLLWEAYGTETLVKWGTSVLASLQQTEVLQQGVHERGVQSETENREELDGNTPPCQTTVAKWLLRDMRKQSECGCSPYRWEPSEQRFIELTKALPELSYPYPSSAKDLFDMWEKGEGIWLLQQALYQIQEVRKSVNGEWKGGDRMTAVRRLTPL